jgi:hypothetical protein
MRCSARSMEGKQQGCPPQFHLTDSRVECQGKQALLVPGEPWTNQSPAEAGVQGRAGAVMQAGASTAAALHAAAGHPCLGPHLLLVAEAGGVVERRRRPHAAGCIAAIHLHRYGAAAVPFLVRQTLQARGCGLHWP